MSTILAWPHSMIMVALLVGLHVIFDHAHVGCIEPMAQIYSELTQANSRASEVSHANTFSPIWSSWWCLSGLHVIFDHTHVGFIEPMALICSQWALARGLQTSLMMMLLAPFDHLGGFTCWAHASSSTMPVWVLSSQWLKFTLWINAGQFESFWNISCQQCWPHLIISVALFVGPPVIVVFHLLYPQEFHRANGSNLLSMIMGRFESFGISHDNAVSPIRWSLYHYLSTPTSSSTMPAWVLSSQWLKFALNECGPIWELCKYPMPRWWLHSIVSVALLVGPHVIGSLSR